jgi:hypothetical protein
LDGSGAAGFRTGAGVQQRVRMFMELGWEKATCLITTPAVLKSHTTKKQRMAF